jgi:multidrug efflux pump subunit AcrA (membrane-fusion protein)
MFAQGQILLGTAMVTVLPRESVIFRDGYPYVFVALSGADGGATFNVEQRRITVGGQRGEFTEVRSGLKADERIVVRGAGFLSDGDLVREVAEKPALAQAAEPATGTSPTPPEAKTP